MSFVIVFSMWMKIRKIYDLAVEDRDGLWCWNSFSNLWQNHCIAFAWTVQIRERYRVEPDLLQRFFHITTSVTSLLWLDIIWPLPSMQLTCCTYIYMLYWSDARATVELHVRIHSPNNYQNVFRINIKYRSSARQLRVVINGTVAIRMWDLQEDLNIAETPPSWLQ